MGIPSRELKHKIFVAAVIEGGQTVKLIVNGEGLTEGHGIPASVLARFPEGVPLNIDPRYPLDLMCDAKHLMLDLSFGTSVSRCFIPWDAVAVFAIGLGGVKWEYEVIPEPEADPAAERVTWEDGAGNTVIDLASRRKR